MALKGCLSDGLQIPIASGVSSVSISDRSSRIVCVRYTTCSQSVLQHCTILRLLRSSERHPPPCLRDSRGAKRFQRVHWQERGKGMQAPSCQDPPLKQKSKHSEPGSTTNSSEAEFESPPFQDFVHARAYLMTSLVKLRGITEHYEGISASRALTNSEDR